MPTLNRAPLLLALLALAAMVLSGCNSTPALRGAPEQAVLTNPNGVTLPTRRCANYFLVEVRLNGRGPFTMVLDTGASQTVVTPRIADMFKTDARAVDFYAEGSQGKRQDVSRILRIHELTIGDASFRDLDAITLDLSRIQATLGSSIDGILGYAAFADVLLTIDYPNSAVRIARGELPRPDGRRILELADSDRPTIVASINGRKRTLLIDTGKAGGFSLKEFDRQDFSNPPATIACGVAIGGPYMLRAGRLSGDIALGDIIFRHPIVESSDASDLLGAEAMKQFAVVLDARRRRVCFERAGERTIICPPVRGIGVGFDFSEGSWAVSHVFPGLPAELAGIQPGDAVIRLDGKRLREFSCTRQLDLFETGDAVEVSVIRERRRLEFKVPIVTLVP